MAPLTGRSWGIQGGGHAGRVAGRLPLIVEETEESGNNHSEETDTHDQEVHVVPQLDIDPTSMILPKFGFSAYGILSYDFGVDVVPLRPLVDRALSMDCTSPY
ncbi:hypothetical protein JCGZ_26528 [Jatropha curcas]|uniref:Uncharacterized protein n=1 Tax=Jatropha curcas TaxID=180498 RepID=A0A067JYG1_JATCU|nr:hypothetical protein JCGZ_26528 [Jatropha curcas]